MPKIIKKVKEIKEKVEKKVKAPSVSVKEAIVYANNSPIRVFSAEIHGKDFQELAQKFATKFGYTVK